MTATSPMRVDTTSTTQIIHDVADRLDRGYTPTAAWYCDPAVYARETQAIFERTWQLVAATTELPQPGAYLVVTLQDTREYILVRGNDGRIRGFANVCPHRANALLSGSGATRLIRCGYHSWTYRLDGSLHEAPGMECVAGFAASLY